MPAKRGRKPELGTLVGAEDVDGCPVQGRVTEVLSIQFIITDENGREYWVFDKDTWREIK